MRILGGNVTLEDGDRKTLDKAFRSWERLPGYPLINVTWNRDNGTVTVKQVRKTLFSREQSLKIYALLSVEFSS